ncbi:MAG: thioesterase [Chloroflexi bacterium]|nr:thioesterase [Chloroflexota bacterium]
MEAPLIVAGMRGEARRTVTEETTADAMGSGDVPVFATPAVLGLLEDAACHAVRDALPDGATSVGVWVELEHLAPSKVGAEVVAVAELVSASGRTLEFSCEARDGDRLVARARHRRAIVDRERFLGRL